MLPDNESVNTLRGHSHRKCDTPDKRAPKYMKQKKRKVKQENKYERKFFSLKKNDQGNDLR